ncbi:ventricular zone-expressed PH domain-containing protein [Lates japonicus]|uniref:Ventricular zone-expressed PH domain-containing protein n=1 Tax=Lates japonicus TaxID=270547 RepID=A0AAD3R5Z3_LATJO|nr:ventricular zone-expressed PH domain-containing protein [Lates japonicus]
MHQPFSQDYLTNDTHQAVVEICITRITTAIRETWAPSERHSMAAPVGSVESCLEHNLTRKNYSCPSVMVLAVPVEAVRVPQRNRS